MDGSEAWCEQKQTQRPLLAMRAEVIGQVRARVIAALVERGIHGGTFRRRGACGVPGTRRGCRERTQGMARVRGVPGATGGEGRAEIRRMPSGGDEGSSMRRCPCG
ncbi:hypothetical protein GCM10009643_17850 [Microbacterium aurantiacum]